VDDDDVTLRVKIAYCLNAGLDGLAPWIITIGVGAERTIYVEAIRHGHKPSYPCLARNGLISAARSLK
jgi:hypothetical protein